MVHISHSGPRSFKSCIYSSYQTQTTSYNTMLHVWRLQSWTKNIVSLQLLENSTFQNTHENLFLFIYYYYFTLQYCIGFTIQKHASATGVHVFPILNPPPTSLPIPSLRVIPVHQPQTSCILHRTWTGDSFLVWYYTCFNAILPNHPPPSPTESKRLFYKSVSLLLSHI